MEPIPDPIHGLPCARSSHGLSVVNNGRCLILYGGEHVARTPIESASSCWALDVDTNVWRLINATTNSPPIRIAHAQAVHNDQNVYVFGGRAGITMEEKAMNDLWKLDASGEPGTEKWTQIFPQTDIIPEARSFHRMLCIGDSLFVFGGCGQVSGRLNDLYRFDLNAMTWHLLGNAALRGRGGPNLLSLGSGNNLAVVAGFAGEETCDGQAFDISKSMWNKEMLSTGLQGMRPRSVSVAASFPNTGIALIFGGEVDPSDRGHEGAGGFENDIVILDEKTGALKETILSANSGNWPGPRGWSAGDAHEDSNGGSQLFLFGGLSGDDENPTRLNDLWRLEIAC